jgi:hypothetical protein
MSVNEIGFLIFIGTFSFSIVVFVLMILAYSIYKEYQRK